MRVLLGMSGGTDSSTTAILLKKKGYEVIGVTYIFRHTSQTNLQIEKAQSTAEKLGINHHVVDKSIEFENTVIKHFVNEYISGKTPSPCVYCNPNAKFKYLMQDAELFNCDKIATGHYINIESESGKYFIARGVDHVKDQSYFLWNVPQSILQSWLTPLGKFTKSEVRNIAESEGFYSVSKQKESMGICFIEGGDYTGFISKYFDREISQMSEGDVYDTFGNKIGTHKGVAYYTIGQKKNMNLEVPESLSVLQIDSKKNRLIVGKREDLNVQYIEVENYSFVNIDVINSENINTFVRGLGLNPKGYSKLVIDNEILKVYLTDDAWAIAPGQPVVFYIGNRVIGGGFAK